MILCLMAILHLTIIGLYVVHQAELELWVREHYPGYTESQVQLGITYVFAAGVVPHLILFGIFLGLAFLVMKGPIWGRVSLSTSSVTPAQRAPTATMSTSSLTDCRAFATATAHPYSRGSPGYSAPRRTRSVMIPV
jgi:hypothetical protein